LTDVSPAPPFHSSLVSSLFINAPFDRLRDGLLEMFLDHRLQPEIGLEGQCLYSATRSEFTEIAGAFKKAGLPCTLHAPFFDLAPGASDPVILKATRNKLKKAFQLIEIFEPVSIVCHLGYEDNKHSFKREEWLQNSTETWREMLAISEPLQVPIMLENTYESGPEQHRDILAVLDTSYARFCLDVGHVLAFAGNTWQDWLPALSPWLGQLHLHDNKGDHDQHLAIGQGSFDFAGLFSFLRTNKLKPVITLEPHRETALWDSLSALESLEFPI